MFSTTKIISIWKYFQMFSNENHFATLFDPPLFPCPSENKDFWNYWKEFWGSNWYPNFLHRQNMGGGFLKSSRHWIFSPHHLYFYPDIGFFHRINLYFYPDIGWEAFFHCKYKYWVSSHRPLTRPPHHPYLIFVTNITSGIGGDKSVMWRHFRFLYLAMWRNLNTWNLSLSVMWWHFRLWPKNLKAPLVQIYLDIC